MNATDEHKMRALIKEQVDDLRTEQRTRHADYERLSDERRKRRDDAIKHLDECVDSLRNDTKARFTRLERILLGAAAIALAELLGFLTAISSRLAQSGGG